MDDHEMPGVVLEQVTNEARSTRSKILLLGIIPIHLYSPSEAQELEVVRHATFDAVKKAAALLSQREIRVAEILRMGYPDEEITKAAEEFGVSLIVIPCTMDYLSELKKAARIILDDIKPINVPILYVPV